VKNITIAFFVCFAAAAIFAQSRHLTRVGVFNPHPNNGDSLMSIEAVRSIRDALHEIGQYDVFTQNRMENAYTTIGRNFPENCQEPRCAAVLGASLQLERMIFGDVAFNSGRYAVELQMVDVVSRKLISKGSFEGGDGVDLNDVIRTTIFRMHYIDTLSNAVELQRYFGAQVDNVRPMLISTGAYMSFAVLLALLGNERQDNWVQINEKLSGIDPSMRTMAKSARAKAMGNAYVALAKDAYGAFYNPAGASWVSGPQASVNYQSRFGMLNTISASFVNKATREIGWGHTLIYSGHPESFYQELFFSTLVSYRFANLGKLPPFSVGGNVNVSSMRITGGSGSKYDQKGTAFGFGLDIGFLMELASNIDFGFVLNNIPTVNFYNNTTNLSEEIAGELGSGYGYRENSPASLTLGGAFHVSYATTLVAEGRVPLYSDQVWRFAGGIEQQIANAVRIRLGAGRQIFSEYETPWHLTCGGGFRFPIKRRNVDIDASYEFLTDRELRHIWDVSIKIDL